MDVNPSVSISNKAIIGKNLVIGQTSIIKDGAKIGDNVKIGRNVVIETRVLIGDNCIIEDGVIIGYRNLTKIWDEKNKIPEITSIKEGVLIRPFSVIYIGCELGKNCKIHHNVILREKTVIGDNTSIGCLVKCEGYTKIGSNCSIHAQTHLTSFMIIEDWVFIGPHVVTCNDTKIDYHRGMNSTAKGPYIKKGARVGSGAIICPGVEIGEDSFVCAGTVVTKKVDAFTKVFGSPAKKISNISLNERLKID